MPLFLIPIAIAAYMYYEQQKKKEEESRKEQPNDKDSSRRSEMAATNTAHAVGSDDNDCEEVIETQLSQETCKETVCISQQVEVTFGDIVVPERQESSVLSEESSGSVTLASETQSTIQDSSSDIEMVDLKKRRSQRLLTSIRKFVREQNASSRASDIRVVSREGQTNVCQM